MRTLGEVDAIEWLSSRGITDSQGRCISLGYARKATYPTPTDSGAKTIVARGLSLQFSKLDESILWIDEFKIWPSAENWYLFDKFRQSLGESRPLWERPGHIFTPSDADAVFALLSMVLYFVWGAVLASSSGDIVVRISHDEFIDVYANNSLGDNVFDLLSAASEN